MTLRNLVLDSISRISFIPLVPPNLANVLAPFTRAVVLTSAGGSVAGSVLAAIADSSVPCELIGHPLIAMAELTRLERDAMAGGGAERTVLIVADRDQSEAATAFDQVDDLKPLFEAVRERLSRVSIYVFADGLPIEICRGRVTDAPVVVEPEVTARRAGIPITPVLRIAPGSAPAVAATSSAGKPAPKNLHVDGHIDHAPRNELDRAIGRAKETALASADELDNLEDVDDELVSEAERAEAAKRESVTREELAMLLDRFDETKNRDEKSREETRRDAGHREQSSREHGRHEHGRNEHDDRDLGRPRPPSGGSR